MILYKADFWFSRQFSGQVGNTDLCLKSVSQKWATFAFGSTYLHQSFTKCMSNLYTNFEILTCQMRLQVMEWPLILLRFFEYVHILLLTIHVWIVVSPPKLSIMMCLINIHMLIYQHARNYSKLWNSTLFYYFFWEFWPKLINVHVWSAVSSLHNLCIWSIYMKISIYNDMLDVTTN